MNGTSIRNIKRNVSNDGHLLGPADAVRLSDGTFDLVWKGSTPLACQSMMNPARSLKMVMILRIAWPKIADAGKAKRP